MVGTPSRNGKRSTSTGLTFEYVKGVARGRWKEIFATVFGIDAQYLTGQHGPCPICQEGTKRWRTFSNFEETGGCICNDCNKNMGDGFKAGAAKLGIESKDVLKLVADHLQLKPQANGSASKGEDPAKHLVFDEGDALMPYFCHNKPPITVDAVKRCHGRQARYRNQHAVLALPVWGEQLQSVSAVGWTMYKVPSGMLPTWPKKNAPPVMVKIKTTFGSQPGWIGPVEELAEATHIWKLEGPSDLLAFYSMVNIPAGHVALTNCNGAGEPPKPWMLRTLKGKTVHVLHDADKAGQNGANGWLELLGRAGINVVQVRLPYEIDEDHGQDLRDYLNERIATNG